MKKKYQKTDLQNLSQEMEYSVFMKLIISLLMFPAFLSLIFSGLCGGFYFSCSQLSMAGEYSFPGHLLKAFLYIAIGIGLSCSIFSVIAGIVLTVVSFIFKSWSRAIVSLAIAFFAGYLWRYFLYVALPS